MSSLKIKDLKVSVEEKLILKGLSLEVKHPAYIGAPDEVIKMLEEELKVCPMTQMVFIIDPPGMAPRHIRNSLELRAKKVIPHFRDK